ncbi:hypothetical protein [Streptomyces sp. MS2.AVA.5]|uniref:Uncharacterized protein n=1 Tax=Streptomyces achmelvichensis TaxID=3134111 RepID=A0ACC6Q8I9_9ACTN
MAAKYVTVNSGGDPTVIGTTAYAIAAAAVLTGALRRERHSRGSDAWLSTGHDRSAPPGACYAPPD